MNKKYIVTIAKWNITALDRKGQEIETKLREYQINICALQKTKKKETGQSVIGKYVLIFCRILKEQRAKEGVALMVHNKLTSQIVKC